MEKTDFSKVYASYYTARTTPEIVTFPAARYVSITGKGDPSGAAFSTDIQALYPVAYGVKAICKAAGKDFGVPKLEGQWWFDEQQFGTYAMHDAPQQVPRSEWSYRLLIRLPDEVDSEVVASAVNDVIKRKKMPDAGRVQYFEMAEGKCVQMLHVGPFANEPATLAILHAFITEQGFSRNGLHHEIYLSDFRKTAPEQLKTILREPVS